MTNKEAIEILKSMKTDLYDSGVDENSIIFGKDIKAINLAIKVLEGKPQGEWIKKQVTPASCTYACSECGIEEVILGNFCCWCGAKMQKGGEKQ